MIKPDGVQRRLVAPIIERFVGRFEENGSRVTERGPVSCSAGATPARCERVRLQSGSGNVDVYFAYPQAGGVLLCIVEQGKGLEPMCRAFMRVEEG